MFNNKILIQWGLATGAAVSGNDGNTVNFPTAYNTRYTITTCNPWINNDQACRWVKYQLEQKLILNVSQVG